MHPANRLLLWCGASICLAALPFKFVLGVVPVMVCVALLRTPLAVKRSLRRMRWLLLALIGVFAWNTPGVYVTSSWYAPSQEGIVLGIEQALRLIGVVASLQLALSGMTQSMLLSACYQLCRPFSLLSIDGTRFAVRLGLTLQYAEQWLTESAKISWQQLSQIFSDTAQDTPHEEGSIEIMSFSVTDIAVSIGVIAAIILIVGYKWI